MLNGVKPSVLVRYRCGARDLLRSRRTRVTEVAMADKTSFTPDEWTKLLESPMMAGIAITAAEPSGLWGLLKESLSGGWALLEAKTSGPNELIKAVATDFGTSEGRAAAR